MDFDGHSGGTIEYAMEDKVAKGESRKQERIDPAWPQSANGEHPVSELAADRQGALSPFGDVVFPLESVPYVHPETEVNWER